MLSLIFHAARWPAGDRLAAVPRLVEEAAGESLEVRRAHDDPQQPRGAAARINEAVHQTTGTWLLIADPAFEWDATDLAAFLAATRIKAEPDLLVLAPAQDQAPGSGPQAPGSRSGSRLRTPDSRYVGGSKPRAFETPTYLESGAWSPEPDPVRRLCEAYVDTVAGVPHRASPDPPLWAISRHAFEALGGLDERLWSVGVVADLAARAAVRGISVRTLSAMGRQTAPNSAPLTPHVRAFLAWRNPLMTAAKTMALDALADQVSRDTAAALLTAWRASGIDAEALRFGGEWGDVSLVARLRAHLRGIPPTTPWPRDEGATVIPLLALHSFLDELPGLIKDREQASQTSQAPDSRLQAPGTSPLRSLGASTRPRAWSPESGVWSPEAEGRSPESGARSLRVSVIVVNWNGREYLRDCFGSLRESDYPEDRLELICVDNGSTDGSQALLAQELPGIRLVQLDENHGFTGANRAGVEAATGDVLLFLNNDMRVERDTVRHLVDGLDDSHQCVAARVLSWDGRRIDFVSGTSTFEAFGAQERYGKPNRPEYCGGGDTFFPNGGAFAITREAWDASGGFDASFFAYYDDVDLGWRVRLAGYEIRTALDAVVYHRHGGTSGRYPDGQKHYLMERNALWTILKTYDDHTLTRILPCALLLAARRITQDLALRRGTRFAQALRPWVGGRGQGSSVFGRRAASDTKASGQQLSGIWRRAAPVYDIGADGAAEARVIADMPIVSLAAAGVALSDLPRLAEARTAVQRARRAPDREILPLLGRSLEPPGRLNARTAYRTLHERLLDLFEIPQRLRHQPRVLIITHEALKDVMSGPAIRALEMGRALRASARVTIAAPAGTSLRDDRCAIVAYDADRPSTLRTLAEGSDLVVAWGFTFAKYPALTRLLVPLVVDLYCPFTLEHLEQHRPEMGHAEEARTREIERAARQILDVQNHQLAIGDFFICASERQRDFWIGALHTAGRINPRTIAADPSLRALIDVVPFGIPEMDVERFAREASRMHGAGAPQEAPRRVLKGVHPAIGPDDKLLLWGGSLLDWQDPHTLIRAVKQLVDAGRDDVKLFFMGVTHPNPEVSPMRVVESSMALARELGLLDTHVVFNDWVPYQDRAAYLLEADVGVSTHLAHLETRFSFRTRMLDYVWARLPIVCSAGDHFGDVIASRKLGQVVPPGDVEQLASALAALLDDPDARAAAAAQSAQLAEELRWSRVVEPLRRFCEAPRFAADRARSVVSLRSHLERAYRVSKLLKRTALGLGVSERQFEAFKQLAPVRYGMSVRNRLTLFRARRAS